MKFSASLAWASAASTASALTISEINGNRYLSPYQGQTVHNVAGVVLAKSSTGLHLRGLERSRCVGRASNAIYVYGSALGKNASIAVGDVLTLSGRVSEYRSSEAYLYLTELMYPEVTAVGGRAENKTSPLIIGKDTLPPPTEQFTSLDNGDIFGVPNNQTTISATNPKLQPSRYGMDFWESLSGELVTVQKPVAISKPNSYGETWVTGGDWTTTGKNGRGGLTLQSRDANPEAIIVGSPLDGTKNKDTYKIGDVFEDITGVIRYQYGFYYLLPTTAMAYVSSAEPALPPASTLASEKSCKGITVGDYNVENLTPNSPKHVKAVAAHIADYMKSPDVLFVQEIQDGDGSKDDGLVDANKTLSALATAIEAAGGVAYDYVDIAPVNDEDGGQPGGNIRVAYLYNPEVVRLVPGTKGNSTEANAVLKSSNGSSPTLKYNPGRIDPANAAWFESRKPLVAHWEVLSDQSEFFTVNVHWSSKGGSSSLFGDPRPPVNSPIDQRIQQANVTGSFVADLLAVDPDAHVVFAGDCNEYGVVEPMYVFGNVSGLVDLDDAIDLPAIERYTYTYGNDMEELDHMFVSPAIAAKKPQGEHIHVNTWVNYDDQVSDHDPTVAKVNVCSV